jgi:1,4-dihydroxy-6-naphthoate synthase
MRMTVAHSPDSDDAFMFYGLASGAVDTGDVEVGHLLSDIETLNRAAFDGKYEVTAVSFHAYAYLQATTSCCRMAPAWARTTARSSWRARTALVARRRAVAVPGMLTSAYLALKLYDSSVETCDAVRRNPGRREAGRRGGGTPDSRRAADLPGRGLRKIVDLGEWWAERTGGLPLPLGGNVIRRDLGPDMIARVSRMLHASIKHALDNRQQALGYAMQFGRGLDPAKVDRFVGMYVNSLTLGYTDKSRRAVQLFLDQAHEKGIIPSRVSVEFA